MTHIRSVPKYLMLPWSLLFFFFCFFLFFVFGRFLQLFIFFIMFYMLYCSNKSYPFSIVIDAISKSVTCCSDILYSINKASMTHIRSD